MRRGLDRVEDRGKSWHENRELWLTETKPTLVGGRTGQNWIKVIYIPSTINNQMNCSVQPFGLFHQIILQYSKGILKSWGIYLILGLSDINQFLNFSKSTFSHKNLDGKEITHDLSFYCTHTSFCVPGWQVFMVLKLYNFGLNSGRTRAFLRAPKSPNFWSEILHWCC